MKINIDLSPNEIFKLGKLTNSDFANGWNSLVHTHDTISFAIHQLINDIDEIITDEHCDEDEDNE